MIPFIGRQFHGLIMIITEQFHRVSDFNYLIDNALHKGVSPARPRFLRIICKKRWKSAAKLFIRRLFCSSCWSLISEPSHDSPAFNPPHVPSTESPGSHTGCRISTRKKRFAAPSRPNNKTKIIIIRYKTFPTRCLIYNFNFRFRFHYHKALGRRPPSTSSSPRKT